MEYKLIRDIETITRMINEVKNQDLKVFLLEFQGAAYDCIGKNNYFAAKQIREIKDLLAKENIR